MGYRMVTASCCILAIHSRTARGSTSDPRAELVETGFYGQLFRVGRISVGGAAHTPSQTVRRCDSLGRLTRMSPLG